LGIGIEWWWCGSKFSSVLNIILRIFAKNFPFEMELYGSNVWIAKGIRTSCKQQPVIEKSV
jgi:hypothetical protein